MEWMTGSARGATGEQSGWCWWGSAGRCVCCVPLERGSLSFFRDWLRVGCCTSLVQAALVGFCCRGRGLADLRENHEFMLLCVCVCVCSVACG